MLIDSIGGLWDLNLFYIENLKDIDCYFRLCLVRVKAFLKNIPFFGNIIFRKEKCFHVFGCISKYFSKNIFWCLEKKLEKKKEEAKPRKTRTKPRRTQRDLAIDGTISRSTARSHDRRSDLAKRRSRVARTVLREIAISNRDRRCDLAKRRSRSVRKVLRASSLCAISRSFSLSFSLCASSLCASPVPEII